MTVSVVPLSKFNMGAKIALAGYANSPNTAADDAAIQRLATASGLEQAKVAVGLAPPPPSSTNPQAGRTILGVPVVDVGVGAAVVGVLGYLAMRAGWL
jgi:hypothetical protein